MAESCLDQAPKQSDVKKLVKFQGVRVPTRTNTADMSRAKDDTPTAAVSREICDFKNNRNPGVAKMRDIKFRMRGGI